MAPVTINCTATAKIVNKPKIPTHLCAFIYSAKNDAAVAINNTDKTIQILIILFRLLRRQLHPKRYQNLK